MGTRSQQARPAEFQDDPEPGREGAVEPRVSGSPPIGENLDVRALQSALERQVGPAKAPTSRPAPAPGIRFRARGRFFLQRGIGVLKGVGWRRAGKVALGLGIVGMFGILPVRTLLQTSSVEAVVNARIVTLRSPIEGEVVASPAELQAPGILPRGIALLHVVNARADRGRLDELNGRVARLGSQRQADETRLVSARSGKTSLMRRAEAFRVGRIEQLKARVTELESDAAAAAGRGEEATEDRDRAALLARSGSVSKVQLAHLTRLATIAVGTATAARARLMSTAIQLASAKDGILLGDDDADLPNSVLRDDELRRQIADLEAEIASLDAELREARQQVVAEQARFGVLDEVTMTVPASGRIWEAVVSPGEHVRAGQDLVRLIDCSTAVVTADVTESVYNRLTFGSTAQFIPADGGPDLAGHVVQLTGIAAAPGNLAIEPAALRKEPYRVSVSIPRADGTCAVGRTGRVVFGKPDAAGR